MPHHKRLTIVISCLSILAATVFAFLFGVVGHGRSFSPSHLLPPLLDAKVLYIAGKLWLQGLNAYDVSVACNAFGPSFSNVEYVFAYPPSSAVFVMLLALLDIETAQVAFTIVNILCLIIFTYINLRILCSEIGTHCFVTDLRKALLITMTIGNVAVANTLFMGQTSILISACLILSYYYYRQSNDIASGLFLSIALIKPQLSGLFFLWLLMERKYKILTVSLVSTAALFIIPFSIIGVAQTVSEWIHMMRYYAGHQYNQVGYNTLSAAVQLLRWIGFQSHTSLIVIFFSLFLVVWMHLYCKNISLVSLFGMLSVIGLLFGQAHHYDLFIATAILPYFLSKIPATGYRRLLLFIVLFVIFNLPRRGFLLELNSTIIDSHREIMLFFALLFMLKKGKEDVPAVSSDNMA